MDIDGQFIVYINIENELLRAVVTLEEQEKFETEHNIIIKSQSPYDWLKLYKIREAFFLNCITYNQQTAIEKIKEMTIDDLNGCTIGGSHKIKKSLHRSK